jgi:hypothetical protein
VTPAESIASRLISGRKLVTQLDPGAVEMLRATATVAMLVSLESGAAKLTSEELTTRAAATAKRRDAQRRYSESWVRLDAEFDVLVGIEEDINPTPREEMGQGSNPLPAPAEDPAAPAPVVV